MGGADSRHPIDSKGNELFPRTILAHVSARVQHSALTKRMTILYCLRTDRTRPRRNRPMFSRWGAFVYRFRRPIALLAVLLAIASLVPRLADVGGAELRRLARRRLRVGRGRSAASTTSSARARARSSRCSAPTTPARTPRPPEFQAAIATALAGSRRRRARRAASSATPRPATTASSAPPATRPTSSSSSTSPTRSRSSSRRRRSARDRAAGRLHATS